MPRLMISCVLSAVVVLGVAASADTNEPPKYVSAALNPTQMTRLTAILDAMETLGKDEDNEEAEIGRAHV